MLKAQLKQHIKHFHEAKILVVGDIAIDEMIYGDTSRMSREAPVLILKHTKTDVLLGAAGNAAHNLASLGAKKVYLAGVCGEDYNQKQLEEALKRDNIATDALVSDPSRPTTTKTRITGRARQSVQQQIVRIDQESEHPLAFAIEEKVINQLLQFAPQCQAILLSDYNLGVITPRIIETCRQLAEKHNLIWAVDSHRPLTLFHGATIATPNQPEAEENVGRIFKNTQDVVESGHEILNKSGLKNLLITRGGDGMSLFEGTEGKTSPQHIPVFNKSDVFDVTGAGDTVIATLTLALACGASFYEAAVLGNLAASIVVRRFGTAVTTPDELLEVLETTEIEALLDENQTLQAKAN